MQTPPKQSFSFSTGEQKSFEVVDQRQESTDPIRSISQEILANSHSPKIVMILVAQSHRVQFPDTLQPFPKLYINQYIPV